MAGVRAFIAKHAVAAYFILAFAISWGGALLVIGGSGMSGTKPTDDPRFPLAVIAMIAGPSVAGLLMTGLVHGRAGLRELFARLLEWRVGLRWYGVALLTAPLLMIATLSLLSLFSPSFVPGLFVSDNRASLLLVSVAVGLGAGLFEELGWTGFATPALRRRHGVLASGFILGVWWAAWHLLTNVVWASSASAGSLPQSIYLSANLLGVFVGYLTAFRMLMVWVYDRTGSLFVGVLMHLSFTAGLLVLNPLGLSGASLMAYSYALAAAIWLVVAAVVVANGGRLTRPRLGTHAA